MRRIVIAVFALATGAFSHALAQNSKPSENLQVTANSATTWQQRSENVIQLIGPVTIRTDSGEYSANNAVLWLSPVQGGLIGEQRVHIALLGNARVIHGSNIREGDKLYVTETVRGRIALTAEKRTVENLSTTPLYKQAIEIRPTTGTIQEPKKWRDVPVSPETPAPAGPSTQPAKKLTPVNFQAGLTTQTTSADGKIAYVLSGDVFLTQSKPNGESIELRADRAVIFTQLRSLEDLQNTGQFRTVQDAVYAAYLEGDVQIIQVPAGAVAKNDQRLYGERVYYEFTTDRAILTDAVIHTVAPQQQIPITLRADTIRQLTRGEYRAENVALTTSSFATPSYSINTSRAYVRQYSTNDPRYGDRTVFSGDHATFQTFGVPIFYLPKVAGSMTDRGSPLRGFQIGGSSSKGFSLETEWGLYETLGMLPPGGLDLSYKIDGYARRGFGLGLNGDYQGGFIKDPSKEAWDFSGGFESYLLPNDTGEDRLGRNRARIDAGDGPLEHEKTRGYFLWEHQHFFPQDWQFQFRGGYVSDPTFLEFWRPRTFDNGLPTDVSTYLKRQRNTEALTLLLQMQPNDIVTTADSLQETTNGLGPYSPGDAYPFEVEHLPELGYYRIGDSFLDDSMTFFSANTLSGVRMNASDEPLTEYGFRVNPELVTPGLPSKGQTGFTDDWVYRGDFRQELDWPMQIEQFKVVPFVVGRYTAYSDSVDGESLHRVFAAAGMRATTAFWKVDDSFQSKLFDVNRLRHVVEPGVNLFASVQNEDRQDVYIFDEQIDDVKDIAAVQLQLNQRWQTKRGGPGRWRSVDFFTLNLDASFFTNAPDDDDLPPKGFRGLYFSSLPENSIPRNSINADVLWRVSDTMILLSDLSENIEEMELATTSLGLAVQRDINLNYFVGVRYIGQTATDDTSTIGSFLINYRLSPKYTLGFLQSYEFSEREANVTSFTITRRFDRFFINVEAYNDYVEDESGVRFAIYPEGLGYGIGSSQLGGLFGSE